jgi:hypothetical protein
MSKILPIQPKSNSYGFLKWSLVAAVLLLSMGAFTRANAQAVPEEAEVLSLPPQEAFVIEDKTHVPSSTDNSGVEDKKTFDDGDRKQVVSTRLEQGQNPKIVKNLTPNR